MQRPFARKRGIMRVLLWSTIGFVVASVIGAYFLAGNFLLLLALFALLTGIGLLFLKSGIVKRCAVVLLGFTVGCGWFWCFDAHYLDTAKEYDGQKIETTITVSDYGYETSFGTAASAELYLSGRKYKTVVYLASEESLSPGDTISGSVSIRLTMEGAKQGATYHQGKGIFMLSYADDDAVVSHSQVIPKKYTVSKWKKQITDVLDQTFSEDTLGFARALLLGDSSKLDYEDDVAFQVSGIRHIIAVSGLHISILFALVCYISGWNRVATALIGIPVLVLFAALAGFTPSVVRACIMQSLVILALLFEREYDSPNALSFAVLVMLLVNPLTITSVSFQLSVGCLIGIFLFYDKLYHYFLKKLGKPEKKRTPKWMAWLAGSVAITLSAMIVTTPLCAIYFGTISLVSVLTNLLALWVVSFIFYGIMLTCVLGMVWLPAGKIVAFVVAIPMRYVLWVANIFSGFKLSAVYTCSNYIVAWLVFCYILLALFWMGRKKHPVALIVAMVLGLVLSVSASWFEPTLDHYRFTALDVGQGQCLLWQSDGKRYMVDCGGDYAIDAADSAAQLLLSQGVDHLDGLILTHYDTDHAGGVEYLLTRIDVETLYLPDVADEGTIRETLENLCPDRIVWVKDTLSVSYENSNINFYPSTGGKQGNESCLCVLFQRENCDILITGDRNVSGERALMEQTALPDIEVLVVGHHGSKYSAGLELLHKTRPEVAVISVGEKNSYGHPASETLNRLARYRCKILRTDIQKTIVIKG